MTWGWLWNTFINSQEEATGAGETKKSMTDLELENRRLLDQNEDLKKELDRVKANSQSEAISVVENEWTCIICDGVFINPSTLPCGHTLCFLCLRKCLRTKRTCPICRERVSRQVVLKKNVAIAEMIDRIYSQSSDDLRNGRAAALQIREEEVKVDKVVAARRIYEGAEAVLRVAAPLRNPNPGGHLGDLTMNQIATVVQGLFRSENRNNDGILGVLVDIGID